MAKVNYLRFQLVGLPHESGLFTMHVRNAGSTALSPSDAGTAMTAFRALLNSMSLHIPATVTWSPLGQYKSYDVPTGVITDVQVATGLPANLQGTGSSSSAQGAGMRLNRFTSVIRGTRFIRGAWFFVPLSAASYDNTGEVSSTTKSDFVTAQATFVAAMTAANLVTVVYSRPRPKGAANGVMADITGETPGGHNALLHKRS